MEDDNEVDQLVENAEVCDGNDVECDEAADNKKQVKMVHSWR